MQAAHGAAAYNIHIAARRAARIRERCSQHMSHAKINEKKKKRARVRKSAKPLLETNTGDTDMRTAAQRAANGKERLLQDIAFAKAA